MNSPAEIAEQYVKIGKGKVAQPVARMFILAILTGLFIGFGGATVAAATVQPPSLAKLVSACIFPAGLTMVLLAGSELFTGNCLLTIPLLQRAITAGCRNGEPWPDDPPQRPHSLPTASRGLGDARRSFRRTAV